MDKKKFILIIFGLIIILILFVIILNSNEKENIKIDNSVSVVKTENKDITKKTESKDFYNTEVLQDIKVPEVDEVVPDSLKEEIAVPAVVAPAAPGVSAKFRSFNIKAEGGKFIPSKIIVNIDDTVHVNFSAIDKDYDIVFSGYNMRQTAKKGQTKVLEFQALQSGNFVYYCDICGGSSSKTKGELIIVE